MRNKKYLFIGTRFGVLQYMQDQKLDVIALIPQKSLYYPSEIAHHLFSNKMKLLELINKMDFDILVSNGCPYILPVSKIKKNHQIFINLHPSLLPNLKGPHPINGAILFGQQTGVTCHIMDDHIDNGEIISQIKIHNTPEIELALLYQMCFLAEIQAFQKGLERHFIPQHTISHNQESYFKRTIESMQIDITLDSSSTIIKKVQAFNIKNQYARLLYKNQEYSINSAKIINNSFLVQCFQDFKDNTIVLKYENSILIKKEYGFLELGLIEKIEDFCLGECLSQTKEISIYQTPAYSSCLSQDNFEFSYHKEDQIFYNISEISNIPNTNFNDMSSPYGYSGYYTNSQDPTFIQEAIKQQEKQAQEKNIIAEFIRFNPYQNHKIFKPFLDFYSIERQIVEVNTNYQIRWDNYHSRLKNKIRKSLSNLQIQESHDIEKFFELYTQTMQRNQATDFYFFPFKYFQKLSKLNGFVMLKAVYEREVCAMAIFLCDKERSYYHLGANSTSTILKNLNAMGAIFETFFQYAEQRGIISCLLGGGRNSDPHDTLLQYKKQYSPILINFYIGGKIYDHQAYQKLSREHRSKYFLKYRF